MAISIICLLWEKKSIIYSNPLPIFKCGYLSFYCCTVSAPYTFWILNCNQTHDLQNISSHSVGPSFYFYLFLKTAFIDFFFSENEAGFDKNLLTLNCEFSDFSWKPYLLTWIEKNLCILSKGDRKKNPHKFHIMCKYG